MNNVSLRARGKLHESAAVLLMAAGVVSWPFYLFPPGMPQVFAFLMVMSFGALFIRMGGWMSFAYLRQPEIQLLWCFVGYTLIVNLATAWTMEDFEPLQATAFYATCAIAASAFHILLKREPRLPRLIYYAVVTSLMLQVPLLLVMGVVASDTSRQSLMFNNPNQLGFYGLITLTFLLYLHRKVASPRYVLIGAALVACILILVSLSKAAMLSAAALLALKLLLTPASTRAGKLSKPLVLAALPLLAGILLQVYGEELVLLNRVTDRLSTIGSSNDDSADGRGYARIFEHPEFLFLGAGEGLYERWVPAHEVHSLLGTAIFSYGIPGFTLICTFLVVLFRRSPRDTIIYVVPVLLYSLTHNPLRQVMMWALFMFIGHIGTAPKTTCVQQHFVPAADSARRFA